jgi:transposase
VFEDESGFMLEPVRRRTWAPRGRTPVQHAWDRRHARLSAISAITLSRQRRRLNLYFRVQQRNVCAEDMVSFVLQLHGRLRQPIILVWDRSGPHRKAARLLQNKSLSWLRIDWLPAYAPELNPTEQCWNHAKRTDLANYFPDDIDQLSDTVRESISKQRERQQLLRSHFRVAKLRI